MKKDFLVVKHNKLIEAGYKLSLAEQRVLLSCISQIDSRKKIDPGTRFEITAGSISDLMNLPLKQSYEVLFNASEQLAERWVTIDDPDPESPWEKIKCRWVESISYNPGSGSVGLRFGITILPYLTQLTEQFTKYKIKYISKMNSVYGVRLYELLVQWQSFGEKELSIDYFKSQMGVVDKYSEFRYLKKRVITPAIEQINEHSNLWVDFNLKKAGRKITHIQFKFGIKEEFEEVKSFDKKTIEQLANPGETWEEATKRIKKKVDQQSFPF